MNVGNSVRKAIMEWQACEPDASMLHACNAIDGTAKKLHPSISSNKIRFTRLLRENYSILGPMGIPGIDLENTPFPVPVRSTVPGGRPDIADVIYGIHRCHHGHGEALPSGFKLIPDAAGPPRKTSLWVEQGKVRLSDRIIFGLLAVAVLSPANYDQSVPDGYYLTFGADVRMPINEWWGRAADFPAIAAADPVPLVVLNFGDWLEA